MYNMSICCTFSPARRGAMLFLRHVIRVLEGGINMQDRSTASTSKPPPQAQDIPDSEPPRESVAPGRGARQQRVHRNDERHTTRWRRVATVGEHRAARTRSVYSLSLSNPDATELGTPWPAAPLATPGHQIRGRHAGTGVKHIG